MNGEKLKIIKTLFLLNVIYSPLKFQLNPHYKKYYKKYCVNICVCVCELEHTFLYCIGTAVCKTAVEKC